MKKQTTPRLTLCKETLRALESTEPSLVIGGQGDGRIDTTWPSCPSVCATC